jgi:purine-cytosine permease-like protein
MHSILSRQALGTGGAEVAFFLGFVISLGFVLHGKALTADNLAVREWPHNPICKLCMIHQETVQHLLLE